MTNDEKRTLKVFLCHASGDKPQVRSLYKRLIAEGVDAWLDQEKLLPGQDWRVEIPRAVQEADVVVVCLSNKSITKEGYIQKEIKFALDSADEKPDGTIFLIPARLEDCLVPEKLSRWQWVDLFEDAGYIKLLSSLKLRADKTGAVINASSYQDSDAETEQRLDQYFTEGLAAFYTEDWDKACQRFQLILREKPNYKAALEKLEDAERQRDLSKLYTQSIGFYQAEDWQAAIRTLDELLKSHPNYKDSALLYKNAKKQKQLKELYAEAKRLHTAEKWLAVVKVFEQISIIDPNLSDPDGLLPSAEREVVEIKRLSDLNGLYAQSVREMDAGKWYEARELLEQVHKAQTGFLETERLLKKIDDEILKIEEGNKRVNQINTLYEQAHGLIRAKSWRKALDKIEEIYKLDSQFEDKDHLAEISKAELEHEDVAAQKQNQLAAIYADAVRLLKEGKYQEALEKWDEVKAIDPKYPDRQRVDAIARKKLAELNKNRKYKITFWKNKSVFKWVPVFLLASIAIGIVIFTVFSPKIKIVNITVPGNSHLGTKYLVPVSGYFTFQYVDSAYTAYDLYSYNSPELHIWDTMVQCYKGEEPQWNGIDLNSSSAFLKLGSLDFSTKEIAIMSTSGAYKKIYLEKGQWITCVVADQKWNYIDNSGEIILDVYYSLK